MEDSSKELKKEMEEERLNTYLEKYAPERLEKKKNKDIRSFVVHS